MPGKGLSNYLTGATDDWKSLIVPVKSANNMAVLPIGHRPPNPAELLDNDRLGDLMQELSAEYDYVFLDCPPVDIVVDTQIIEKYVHRTIFVVRAGLLEKSAIPEIDAIYESNRFKHMSVILNGTPQSDTRYGTYGSSYYGSNYEVE
jgi:capsular exopolysaccharide synthesis family protein